MRAVRQAVSAIAPGLGALLAGAVLAWLLGQIVPWPDALLLAVVLGVLAANLVGIPEALAPGIETHSIWLGAGIVLMGASVPIQSLVDGGPLVVALVIGVVVATAVLVEVLAKNVFGIRRRLSSLLAVGTGICGVSAVVAVAGSIDADEELIAYAAGTILLFDAITLAVYPAVGSLLQIPDQVFGVWAGLSMFSTGPVVAAGFAHSEVAGQWATVTKLARNALIGVVVVVYAAHYARREANPDEQSRTGLRQFAAQFPTFVLGFVLLAVIASLGLISDGQVSTLEETTQWLFLIAFVGLGTELDVEIFTDAGIRPVVVVLLAWSLVASVTLAGTWVLFG